MYLVFVSVKMLIFQFTQIHIIALTALARNDRAQGPHFTLDVKTP